MPPSMAYYIHSDNTALTRNMNPINLFDITLNAAKLKG